MIVASVYESPGVFIEELAVDPPPISALPTGVTAFAGSLGAERDGLVLEVTSFAEFSTAVYGHIPSATIGVALDLYFRNGGRRAIIAGCANLENAQILDPLEEKSFDLLCLPAGAEEIAISTSVHEAAAALCDRKRAMYLVDAPSEWSSNPDPAAAAKAGASGLLAGRSNAALYFPRLNQVLRADGSRVDSFPPSPAIAGIMARFDTETGVWKAPAGLEARVLGVEALDARLLERDRKALNPEGINCLRRLPGAGVVVWGARTRIGQDGAASDWKYVNIRRLALFLKRSIEAGLQWTVFEPTGDQLWAKIRQKVEEFLHGLFKQGAFQGRQARDAYFVRCDRTTMTQDDIDNGRVIVEIGFAPIKPAEFIILRIGLCGT